MRKRRFSKKVLPLLSFLSIVLILPNAYAVTIDLVGINDPNNLATVNFVYDPGAGKIDVDIENTSLLYDPRLTGFAFNVPDSVTGILSFTGPTGWDYIFDPDDIDTPGQFGKFDLAGVTGPNFEGGDPNDGIPRGDIFAFEFLLIGSGLGGLTTDDFLSQLSYDPMGPPDESQQPFIARFQRTGTDGNGSDVAVVPLPGTLLLLGSGLAGLAAARRKFGKK